MRQIVLDTETTGRDVNDNHRIIEIGCIELINRRFTGKHFHYYINAERDSEAGALAVHGITQEFLADKPKFPTVVDEFIQFVQDAELIIHNAPFDIGFLNAELKRVGSNYKIMSDYCSVLDTLPLARQIHPGQRNSLDALCKRYQIDNSQRNYHGALLDAELLARVYLAMTGGQTALFAENSPLSTSNAHFVMPAATPTASIKLPLTIIYADEAEKGAHQAILETIAKKANCDTTW